MLIKRVAACAIVAAGLVSTPANAGYFGATYSQNEVGDWSDLCSFADDGSFNGSESCEDTGDGFRVFGGFGSNKNFSFEIGYSDFGEVTFDAESDGSGGFYPAGPVSYETSANGIDFSVVGRVDVSESLDFIGRIGILKWEADFDASDSTGSESGSEDGTDIFFGLGAELAISPAVGVRGEYTLYELDDTDLDSLSLSLVFRGGN